MNNRDALAGLKLLLARPDVSFLDEPPGTVALRHRLGTHENTPPRVRMDADLAAFASRAAWNS